MKLVMFAGEIYCLSDRAYTNALRMVASGQRAAIDMEYFGERVGQLDADLTDMQEDEAERCLNDT